MNEKRQPKIWAGFMVFIIVILLIIFVFSPVQKALGIFGLLLTEMLILACAVAAVFIFRYDIREVMPIRLPSLRQIAGVVQIWIGALMLSNICTYVTIYLYPRGMAETAKALGNLFAGAPLIVSLVSVALLPAICEEALCRGFIQYSFGGIGKKWLIVFLSGLLFGLLHVSPYRFLPTVILGFALSYIMAETGNILLPMIFHYVNNAFASFLLWMVSGMTQSVSTSDIAPISAGIVGGALIIGALFPWLLLSGSRSLKSREAAIEKRPGARSRLAAAAVSVIFVTAGIYLFFI